tara:strand:+ start:125 stop:250 length:126 start_codon:yes stop_codon:yes gene_type:complete
MAEPEVFPEPDINWIEPVGPKASTEAEQSTYAHPKLIQIIP